MIEILISLLPVFIFLIVLIYLDSYKLVKITTVSQVILIGFASAFLSLLVNKTILNTSSIDSNQYARYAAPVIEEILKALFIIYMISKKKIGFMVDAAIYGFAIGAGFALIENIYYLNAVESSNIFLWIIRGFGTAVMHGGTTAIFAILTKGFYDRSDKLTLMKYLSSLRQIILNHALLVIILPGVITAIIIHSFFNYLIFPPILITALQLLLLPPLIMFVFNRNEIALREWLETGLDKEVQLLEQIDKGVFSESHAGQYLLSLRNKFSGIVLSDMLCLIKIHLELSIRAKGVMLLRKAGLPVIIEEEVKDKLEELKYLEKSIGPTGKLAVSPIFSTSTRDLWQLYMLGQK